MRKSSVVSATLATLLFVSFAAQAQRSPIPHEYLPYNLASGDVGNMEESSERVVFEEVVDAGDSDWMRLGFNNTILQGESYLRLTSLYDGHQQHLDATNLERWADMSAYFNGSQIRVELVAAPGSWRNQVNIDHIIVNGIMPPPAESQCGPTDDREPSSFPERARLMTIGCTGGIITEGSCFLTAGHCIGNGSATMQFNVPPSLSNGQTQNPAPEHQYPKADLLSDVSGQVGNDYATFTVFPSSETGLLPYEAYGVKLDIADSLPPIGGDITIVGYGVDGGTRNQTQQIHIGPRVEADFTDALEYQADTEGGNSGSPVVRTDTGEVIGVHTHAGCSNTEGNQGTSIFKPALQAGIDACPTAGETAFDLDAPTPGLPGQSNTWSFDGATPGANIVVIFGGDSGTTAVPGCDEVNIAVANGRVIGSAIADGNGNGSVARDVPGGVGGKFFFQAIDMSTCRVSDRVTSNF